jgi:3-hydroxyacyl-CoA dehydrogenase/enoyl-CoA hydratase/3-hydroxybutyryl-CoA epimerase
MKVVEIIMGEKTSEDTLRKSYDYVQQIGYMPIVVNDSRGFFTSRVFGTYLDEGQRLLLNGMSPAAIERAAWIAGMPVGPLAVYDEVSMVLSKKVRDTHIALDKRLGVENGYPVDSAGSREVAFKMLEDGRGGRQYGGGFYDYHDDGSKTLWPGLSQYQGSGEVEIDQAVDRLLYRQAVETLRCFDEGVLRSEVEANLGGIFAIGFPAHTGGALQYIRGIGIDNFEAKAADFATSHGDRFAVSPAAYEKLRATVG